MDEPQSTMSNATDYIGRLPHDPIASAPSSASKRKREEQVDSDIDSARSLSDDPDSDVHTPKRQRHHDYQSEAEVSDTATPIRKRNVRRKKGVNNLSTLSLRHSARKDAQKHLQARESKFQEGSFTDKPSERPASIYTRMARTASGNLVQVDALMEDYHDNGRAGASSSASNYGTRRQAVGGESGALPKKEESSGFFRFGKNFAQNFHPVALWNKMWSETKEELTRQNMEEAERKARLKAEAEARYAEMKKKGQFVMQPVGTIRAESRLSGVEVGATPRDSGIDLGDSTTEFSHGKQRDVSMISGDESNDRVNSKPSNTTDSVSRGFRSHLHFKKPSLSNIRDGIKRMGSDLNLAGSAYQRGSSSSLSPVKTEFDPPTLRSSHSRFDLKRQQKLTKRVSDLEFKLQQARHELEEALEEASPMPKLGNRYERFTPVSTVKRPKFVPGTLPSLPSERLLTQEESGFNTITDGHVISEAQTRSVSRPPRNLTELFNKPGESEDEATIRARKPALRPRLSSLFKQSSSNEVQKSSARQLTSGDNGDNVSTVTSSGAYIERDMDSVTSSNADGDDTIHVNPQGSYASLDAKLKALEQNAKLAKQLKKPKKRKSAGSDGDKAFQPDGATDDDSGRDATPKKKRKSNGGKTTGGFSTRKHSTGHCQGRAENKASIKTRGKMHLSPVHDNDDRSSLEENIDVAGRAESDAFLTAETATSQRNSLDSQPHSLEPLVEEEEIVTSTVTTIPLKDVPFKPTARATPARHSHSLRARSASPNKLPRVTENSDDEHILLSGDPTKKPPISRRARTNSPSRKLFGETTEDEILTAVPGSNGVPKLPVVTDHGLNGHTPISTVPVGNVAVNQAEKDDFKWPDDVF